MLSEDKKSKLIQLLKDDYVVITDTVVEVVADTEADMLIVEKATNQDFKGDEKLLFNLKREYSDCYAQDPVKAIDIVEKIFELSEKYSGLRMQL